MVDAFIEIRKKYLSSFSKKRKDIITAWNNKDVPQLHYLIHNLAGSSGSYGFEKLSASCYKVTAITEHEHSVDFCLLQRHIHKILKLLNDTVCD